MVNMFVLIAFEHLALVGGVVIWLLFRSLWRYPVVILRYVGNKQRPTLIVTKARRTLRGGLKVKGFKHHIKDFDNKDYYPSLKGHGALLVWEFKPGWLVPTFPKKIRKQLSAEERELLDRAERALRSRGVVNFEFDKEKYERMVLQAIDSVDSEYFLDEMERQASQYTGGWRDFLTKNLPWIAFMTMCAFALIGYIVYLDKAPDIAGQCIDAGVDAARNTYLRELVNTTTQGQVPLG